MSKLTSKGLTGLAFWDNGFHMVSANKPLLKPTDFQGIKIRISGSKVADQYFRKLGAIPQILAFLRGLSGAADRRRGRLREHTVQLPDSEIPRGAEAHHGLLSRAPAIRSDL